VKWFPDMRGFITGLAVLGFGAGSMIGAPVGTALIGRIGVLGTFAVFGVVFGILTALAGAMLRTPPPGYKPAGWSPPVPTGGKPVATKYDYAPSEMVKTPQFFLLWFIYLFGAGVGLMAISQAVPMGVELAKVERGVAAAALGTMAIFNGLGRPAFGAISDKIGRSNATMLAFALYIVALLGVLRTADTIALYTVGISMVGFAYGGYLALMPSYTADYFGTKNLGINYGWVFSAWGAAGILGPVIGAQVRAVTGAWTNAFWILAGMCVAGILIALITKAPKAREVEAPAKA
jgi:OFA family oxalate/formate antiporter-like MFS transporter